METTRAHRDLPDNNSPGLYVSTIEFWPNAICLESNSLKLYLEARLCEALAVKISDDVA